MYKLIAITMLSGGCVASPLPAIPDSSGPDVGLVSPVAGVYDLRVLPATGDCRPATVSGPLAPLQQAIETSSGTLLVEMPDAVGAVAAFSTRPLDGYRWQADADVCGAHVSYDVTAIRVAADALTLVRSELWSGTSGRTPHGTQPASGQVDGGQGDDSCNYVPPTDCGSGVTLRYQLAVPCAAPCAVEVAKAPAADGFPALSCVCPAGA